MATRMPYMRRLLYLSPFLVLILAGCVTPPPPAPEQVAAQDFGNYPENYEALIEAHFAKTLFQPEAARYRFGTPFKGYIQEGPLLGGRIQDTGYFVEVWVRAKDRSGAYLPEQHRGVLIKNGEVLMEFTAAELPTVQRAP